MTRSNRSKSEDGKFSLDIQKRFSTVRLVRHWHRLPRGCGCPNSGSVQSQAAERLELPGLVGSVPAHGREVGTGRSLRSLPTLNIL